MTNCQICSDNILNICWLFHVILPVILQATFLRNLSKKNGSNSSLKTIVGGLLSSRSSSLRVRVLSTTSASSGEPWRRWAISASKRAGREGRGALAFNTGGMCTEPGASSKTLLFHAGPDSLLGLSIFFLCLRNYRVLRYRRHRRLSYSQGPKLQVGDVDFSS